MELVQRDLGELETLIYPNYYMYKAVREIIVHKSFKTLEGLV